MTQEAKNEKFIDEWGRVSIWVILSWLSVNYSVDKQVGLVGWIFLIIIYLMLSLWGFSPKADNTEEIGENNGKNNL